jgi:peptidoglycan/LPS O-acetylase OafA/YrhL
MHLGFVGTFLFVSAMTISVTILASEVLYRYVEKPCIDFGKRQRSDKRVKHADGTLPIAPGSAPFARSSYAVRLSSKIET